MQIIASVYGCWSGNGAHLYTPRSAIIEIFKTVPGIHTASEIWWKECVRIFLSLCMSTVLAMNLHRVPYIWLLESKGPLTSQKCHWCLTLGSMMPVFNPKSCIIPLNNCPWLGGIFNWLLANLHMAPCKVIRPTTGAELNETQKGRMCTQSVYQPAVSRPVPCQLAGRYLILVSWNKALPAVLETWSRVFSPDSDSDVVPEIFCPPNTWHCRAPDASLLNFSPLRLVSVHHLTMGVHHTRVLVLLAVQCPVLSFWGMFETWVRYNVFLLLWSEK